MVSQPQFLLFCDAKAADSYAGSSSPHVFGRWHFVLERLDGNEQLEAADSEISIHPDRLALLSVVRGLEALEQPSRVNLVTTSRYVSRGLRYGLSNWRESDYHWESFGVQKPIRNADLWQRVDQALQFHGVTCRLIQSNILKVEDAAVNQELAPLAATAPIFAAVHEESLGNPQVLRDVNSTLERHETSLSATAFRAKAAARIMPMEIRRPRLVISLDWWDLALSWMKWWRARLQRPALIGV
jgi:ribonuclease HI